MIRNRVAQASEPAVSPTSESANPSLRSPRTHASAPAGSETCDTAGSEACATHHGGPRALVCESRVRSQSQQQAYFLTEALVYIGVLLVLLGIGYLAFYHCLDNSVALRRSADDIARAMQAGERWRGDLRLADRGARLESGAEAGKIVLEGKNGRISYRFADGTVFRQVGDGPWVRFLERVKTSEMRVEARAHVAAWRWELELRPQTTASVKPGRFRPLFTFLAVPPQPPAS